MICCFTGRLTSLNFNGFLKFDFLFLLGRSFSWNKADIMMNHDVQYSMHHNACDFFNHVSIMETWFIKVLIELKTLRHEQHCIATL